MSDRFRPVLTAVVVLGVIALNHLHSFEAAIAFWLVILHTYTMASDGA